MPKHRIHRNWDDDERKRHGQLTSARFTREREGKICKAKEVIEEMLASGIKISQNEVARRCPDVSVGFINNHLRNYIESAKKKQNQTPKKPRSIRQIEADTKEVERLKARIFKLEQELQEQRKRNEALLAQVAEVVDLERDINILRQQNRDLIAAQRVIQEKVVPLPVHPLASSTIASQSQSRSTAKLLINNSSSNPTFEDIEAALEQVGVKLNSGLRQEIEKHERVSVLQAIEAFGQYQREHDVTNPIACLRKAIREEWKPNVPAERTAPSEKSVTPQIDEFDEWYAEAIRGGFCLDIPKSHLSEVSGELMVKVSDPRQPSGYLPMPWREAQAQMKAVNIRSSDNA